jgi:hypothetical protein
MPCANDRVWGEERSARLSEEASQRGDAKCTPVPQDRELLRDRGGWEIERFRSPRGRPAESMKIAAESLASTVPVKVLAP